MISICMPHYRRAQQLERTLASYRRHYARLPLEIVICDDGTPGGLQAPGCEVIQLPEKSYALNPCVPINRAVNASRGEIIVLTGPEVVHRHDVLTSLCTRVDDGLSLSPSCFDVTTRTWLVRNGVKNGAMPVPGGFGFYFCSVFTRTAWQAAGGFDEDYRYGQAMEDTDFGWRMSRAGVEFEIDDELIVEHYRSGVRWPAGGLERNRRLFWQKWPDLENGSGA